jgi:hypothetical protein
LFTQEEQVLKKHYFIGLLVVVIAVFSLGMKCEKVTDPMSDSESVGYGQYPPPFEMNSFDSETTCQAACNEYYTELLQSENERFEKAIKACKKIKNKKKARECRHAEIMLHQETVQAINAARNQCVRDCHDQGSVGGSF